MMWQRSKRWEEIIAESAGQGFNESEREYPESNLLMYTTEDGLTKIESIGKLEKLK